MNTISELFVQGDAGWMSILTIELAAIFFAAWKAPAWVKELGAIAFLTAVFSTCYGLWTMFSEVQKIGELHITLWCSGFKCVLVPFMYGLLIFIISLIIRIVQKPRI